MKKTLYLCAIILSILRGDAQNSTLISKNFKFKDGIYYHLADWQKNQPNATWDSLEARLATNPQSLQMYVELIRFKNNKDSVQLNRLWCLVVDGIPYIRVPSNANPTQAVIFSGMVLRGKLCYFQFDEIEEKYVPITAYIPQTGQPYLTKNVLQKRSVVREKLIKFDSGEIFDFTLNDFKSLIQDDKDLLTTVEALKPKEVADKLFKCLLIYNDRNPVFLK